MAQLKVVCAGYVKKDGIVVRCGKFLRWELITDEQADEYKRKGWELVSHGMCDDCYKRQIEEDKG